MKFWKTALPLGALAALAGCGEASSIGIIGGADGPTAIFTTVQASPSVVWTGAAVLLAGIAAGLVLWLKHRK